MNGKTKPSALLPILFAVTAFIYFSAFYGDFQYDDSLTILENAHVESLTTFIGHFDHMVRPVLYATLLIDRSLYGLNPAGYHLLNLLLHLGSGLLIYRILTSALSDELSAIPFWTALLFLIHPIATETVTYISGRASGLMTFFYLLALYLYLQSAQPSNGCRRLYLSGAVASFLLSIGSKETAVTFPLILLLWDWLIAGKRVADIRATLISHLAFWAVLLLAAAWAWSHPRYPALAEFSLTIRPFPEHLLSELHATAYALLLLVSPWNQNFDHDFPVFHSLTQWPLPLDLLLLSVVMAGAFFSASRLPLFAFGLGWFFIQLLPTSLIPRNDLLSERNLYLPAIGFVLAIVTLSSHLIRRLLTIIRRPALVRFTLSLLAAVLVAALCLFTYQRNLLYQDRLLLWSDAVRKSPNKARPHNNLGYAYSLHGDWDSAIEQFRFAAQLDHDYVLAQENLRDAYLHRVGRHQPN
ncbi:MAG TPA: tetratricopeptide repeat protein [Nitrospira sp.]|nr:tetratricopeptide repeat protein [Nitrospira sp.]